MGNFPENLNKKLLEIVNMIVALAGDTGAGKSTLARLLKKPLNTRILTIGYILRANARKQSLPFEEYLRRIESQYGLSAHKKALEGYIRKKLQKFRTVVVEGTYKIEDIQTLQSLFPKEPLFVFYVESAKNIRIVRIMNRQKVDKYKATGWVRDQDMIRKNRFRMEEVAKIADGRIINSGLTKRELFEEFTRQFKKAMGKRIVNALPGTSPKSKNIQMRRKH
ncbi:MAG: AAA family ATPase [Candidatus Diapherotrites archaeon]